MATPGRPTPAEIVTRLRKLYRETWPIKRIAREMGLSKNTVRRYIRSRSTPDPCGLAN